MKVHELKTDPEPFEALWWGIKTAEFRRNDREFDVGDILQLREWMGDCYARREIVAQITHLEFGYGIPTGYVLISFSVIEKD